MNINRIIRFLGILLMQVGLDPTKLMHLKNLKRFFHDRKRWLEAGGKIHRLSPIIRDYEDTAGVASGHYFHQDLVVAQAIFDRNPTKHIDVGSRVAGFVAHVASFREIEVCDVRKMQVSEHSNIKFKQFDFMQENLFGLADSVSCLHTIEHFGMGRYGDPIDPDGHRKGLTNLKNLVATNGHLYVSAPIGSFDEIVYNAHRIFRPDTLPNLILSDGEFILERFDYVDDEGRLHKETKIELVSQQLRFGCGIYFFKKITSMQNAPDP